MQLALKLAQKGLGKTSPNPMVGTVIVKNGKIIGSGYHRMAGDRHAEVIALQQSVKNSKSATLYVNLEPCGHFGQTPPCTEEIIKSGIKRVVCAMVDPNPKVKGKGIEILKKNKIKITDKKREMQVIKNIKKHSSKSNQKFVMSIFKNIVDYSKKIQK